MADWLTSTLGNTPQKTQTKTTRSSDWLDSTSGKQGVEVYKPNKLVSDIKEPITQSIAPKESLMKKVGTETGKFLGRTGTGLLSSATKAVDFVFDMAIRNSQPVISVGGYTPKVVKNLQNRWMKAYEEQRTKGDTPTQKLKEATIKLQNIPYLKPPDDYVNLPLKEKLTKRLGETFLQIGPSVLSSIIPYALGGIVVGATSAALSVADDVKSSAIENGVTPWKAEKLGLGTGVLVSLLDKIVPASVMGAPQKKAFLQSFTKKIANLAINTGKEVGTEIVQEDIQILAESTFREVGIDEVTERNVMAAIGGAMGGFGMTTVTQFANNTLNKDIVQSKLPEPEIKVEKKVEPVAPMVEADRTVETPKTEKPVTKPVDTPKLSVEPTGGSEAKTILKQLENEVADQEKFVTRSMFPADRNKAYRELADLKRKLKNQQSYVKSLEKGTPSGRIQEQNTVGRNAPEEKVDLLSSTPSKPLSVEPVGGKVGGEVVKAEPKTRVKPETKQDRQFTSRVFERLQSEQSDILTGDLKVDKIKLADETKKATDLLVKDKQKAYRIAMGEETSDSVTSTSTNIVMAEKALDEGNNALYAKLTKARSLAQTRRGQEIVSEKGSVSDNSTSRYVKELISSRLENVGKTYLSDLKSRRTSVKEHANKVIDRKVETLNKKIKNKKLDIKTALKLLDEITCV